MEKNGKEKRMEMRARRRVKNVNADSVSVYGMKRARLMSARETKVRKNVERSEGVLAGAVKRCNTVRP